jgi:ParB family transcriptional regulator, chromosome partitioning protein
MGRKLLEKAGLVLAPRGPTVPSVHKEEALRPKTAVGAMAQFTDRQSVAIKEAAQLKEQLKEFDESLPTKLIQPNRIVRSKWANRHELNFTGQEFEDLKSDIKSQGRNVQPIKVRRINDSSGNYEIIFGHRRHRACLDLGIDVLATIAEDLDDKHLFIEMDRENRQRKDLRPYEIGCMYAQALDEGLFPSARKLAEEVGIDQSQLTKALALARLPSDVLQAFTSPLDLQYRWVPDLNEALQRDPDYALALAKSIRIESPRPAAADVFRRLTAKRGTVPRSSQAKENLEGRAGQKGRLEFNETKRSIRIDLANIDPARFAEVKTAIKKLLG